MILVVTWICSFIYVNQVPNKSCMNMFNIQSWLACGLLDSQNMHVWYIWFRRLYLNAIEYIWLSIKGTKISNVQIEITCRYSRLSGRAWGKSSRECAWIADSMRGMCSAATFHELSSRTCGPSPSLCLLGKMCGAKA